MKFTALALFPYLRTCRPEEGIEVRRGHFPAKHDKNAKSGQTACFSTGHRPGVPMSGRNQTGHNQMLRRRRRAAAGKKQLARLAKQEKKLKYAKKG
jgi:hypothetical protein